MASGLDYAIILGYFLVMLAAGYVGFKMAKSSEDFLVAGRRLPFWVHFPCLASVVLGGASTLGGAKLGYKFGISGFWMVFMIGLGVLALGFLLTSKLSNLRIISLSEMLELRYDKNTKIISAVVMVIYTAMIAVIQVIAIGTILNSLMGWPLQLAMLVGGGITLIYTYAGGMWSITITDVIQFVMMTVGVFGILLPVGLLKVGGFSGLSQSLEPSFFSLTAIGWSTILAYFLLFFFGMMIGQDIWQRVFTAKNQSVAKTGTIAAGLYSILYALAMAIIGMVARVLIPGLDNPQSAFPELVLKILPPGLIGLVLVGAMSALMSTITGPVLASSTVILNDIIKPFAKDLAEQKHLFLSKVITVIVGVLVMVFALWIQDVLVALDIAYAILSGSIFVPVVAGFFWKRATWQGALSSVIISAIVILIGLAVEGVSSTNPIIYGIITSLIVLVIGSLMTKPTDEEKMRKWTAQLEGMPTGLPTSGLTEGK